MYNTQLGADIDWGNVLRTGLTQEIAKQPEVQMEVKKAGYATALDKVADFLAKNQTAVLIAAGIGAAFLGYKLLKK